MIYIAGHSLGAARAALYAFSRIRRGLPVDGVFLFGCSRPGDGIVAATLKDVPIRSIKNGEDPVTDVPLDIPAFDFNYRDVAQFEQVNVPWTPGLPDWGPLFNWHHIELYQDGCASLPDNGTLLKAVDACYDLYNLLGKWDWTHTEDGRYWGMRKDGADHFLVARGSATGYDWLEDFRTAQCSQYGAMVSEGFWDGVGPIQSLLDGALNG